MYGTSAPGAMAETAEDERNEEEAETFQNKSQLHNKSLNVY